MARFFFALTRACKFRGAVILGFLALVGSGLQMARGATSPTNAAPANSTAPMTEPSAPGANKMMTNAPGTPMPPPEDTFKRYGNILAPGIEPAHPLRLSLPFPDAGEIKVPSQDELTMREKLEQLATLSDQDIRNKLDQWPPFKTMSLKDEGMMLARIQDFRDRRSRIAMEKAHAIGLTLTPAQQTRFEKEYWDKRLPMERELAKQFEPIVRDKEMKLEEQLFREFSTPGSVLAQPGKPPGPSPAPQQKKPSPPPKPAPVMAQKPAPPPVPIPPPKPMLNPVSTSTNSGKPKPMD